MKGENNIEEEGIGEEMIGEGRGDGRVEGMRGDERRYEMGRGEEY